MSINWEKTLCYYIEEGESYYECIIRLSKKHGSQRAVARLLGIKPKTISNLLYSIKNNRQNGEHTKEVFNHTKKFVEEIHQWLLASDVEITLKELYEFLQTKDGQQLLKAKLILLENEVSGT